MELSTTFAIIITILLTLMTMLMSFFIYQQSMGNKKTDLLNKLLTDVGNRLIKLETEHEMMKENCYQFIHQQAT